MNYQDVILRATEKFSGCKLEEGIPGKLPLLNKFYSQFIISDTFKNHDVLFIQHHLGPLIPRLEAMIQYGLEPSACWCVDIPYSSNARVIENLSELEIPINHISQRFDDPLAAYSVNQLQRVSNTIISIANQEETKPLVVIDDGAYFTRALHMLFLEAPDFVQGFIKRGIHIVEQTTRGHRYLEQEAGVDFLKKFPIPVVSIAKSQSKYELESPFIGLSVCRAIRNSGFFSQGIGQALVIGFGAVGKETTRFLLELQHDGPIHVWDTAWENLEKNEEYFDGTTALHSFPDTGSYDTVFGCTGYASFPVESTEILSENAMLISGSSAAIEFNREKFIEIANEKTYDDFFVVEPETTKKSGIHAKITLQKGHKRFSFINAGFPVNFDGTFECLPVSIIQITHTLLVAASHQTLKSEPGLHELDKQVDIWIFNEGKRCIEEYAGEDN